jgi:hypothetical protein
MREIHRHSVGQWPCNALVEWHMFPSNNRGCLRQVKAVLEERR